MESVVLELMLPQDVYLALQAAGLDRERLSAHATRDLAVQLYSEGRLSLGKAAKLASMNLRDFWQMLIERGSPVFTYGEDEYASDLDAIRQWNEPQIES